MDSLLASYASSDEDVPKPRNQLKKDPIPKSTGFLSSLPRPKPETPKNLKLQVPKSSSFSSLLSSLPPPKAQNDEPQILPVSSTVASKRVVVFRPPPMNPPVGLSDDEDEDEMEKQKKKSESLIQTSSVKSFLSSIPKPKNSMSLGALPSASGTGRRSMLEADVPGSNDSNVVANGGIGEAPDVNGGYYESTSADNQVSVSSMTGASGSSDSEQGGNYLNWGSGTENYTSYDGYTGYDTTGVTHPSYDGTVDYANYSSDNANCASFGPQYENNWAGGTTAASAVPPVSVSAESVLRLAGKRGRNDVPPAEMVEVKQDELMKNRPREDQTKLTGIAFGPSYQPASTKGKPSKLHKRKHQIGSLYFDMKQKEMELAERHSQGFLTKAQTQGKYGW